MVAADNVRALSAADPHWRLDACGLAQAYASGALSPVEVVRGCLDRIAVIDPVINSFVRLAPQAESEAAESAARLRQGQARGPLEGIPIAIKDSLSVAGLPAAWGSRVFASEVRQADELPVRRLRAAGAIVIGKTNTPEFALEGYTGNALYGITRNPWETELTPGGSSGGSVAAVAAGLVTVAIGTDGGGSIRRPAAYTGLCGLKPSRGRIPRAGGLPQILLDFEVVGPLARSVRDLRMLYAAMAGPDRADHRSCGLPAESGKGANDLRILYVERFEQAPCDPVILASVDQAAGVLADLGHRVERAALPFDLTEVTAFWSVVNQVGLARLRQTTPQMADLAGRKYLDIADLGDRVPATDVFAGLQAVEALRNAVFEAFVEWDVIMTPSCAAMPWPAHAAYPAEIDGQRVGARGHAVYTGWVNASGQPAVALPATPAADGLPIGFQLIGDLGAEALLLDLAEEYETAAPWQHRWPLVALV